MNYYQLTDGEYPSINETNENDFMGNGWSIKNENEKYILTYLSGEHGGKLKTHEVSKSDFILAKENKINLDDICIKYNIS